MTYIWIITIFLFVLILWSLLEQQILVIKRYNIYSNTLGKDIDSLSFVVLSDLHNKSIGRGNKRLFNKIIEDRPDFVIIAGDMITKRKSPYPGKAYSFIEKLSEHYPIYYAYGNHEQYLEDLAVKNELKEFKDMTTLYESWCIYKEKLKQLGVFFLDNKSVILKYRESNMTITGLSLSSDFYENNNIRLKDTDEITSNIGTRSNEGFQLLIAHNPLYFEDYILWGADLILSGHMHGGMVRIPFIGGLISPQAKFFPKYDAGLFAEGNGHMVISRGLGSHSFMPRLLNPPELVHITLKNKSV